MTIVTSYFNPDLDGVASAVAYAAYLGTPDTVAMYAGSLNQETSGVLHTLCLTESISRVSSPIATVADVVLVDCHHPAQLPHLEDLRSVSLVIDHHPDGRPGAFCQAKIQNEPVGAAATLIVERLTEKAGLTSVSSAHAALLAAAIASNTLDFSAPSTTDRDHRAYAALSRLVSPSSLLDNLLQSMRSWRQAFLSGSTADAVHQDVKTIETPMGKIAVAQLEADDASLLTERPDLLAEVDQLAERPEYAGALLSLVDTRASTTTLVTSNGDVRRALMNLGPVVVDAFTLRLPYVALRKTHIIPTLIETREGQ